MRHLTFSPVCERRCRDIGTFSGRTSWHTWHVEFWNEDGSYKQRNGLNTKEEISSYIWRSNELGHVSFEGSVAIAFELANRTVDDEFRLLVQGVWRETILVEGK